MARGDRVGKKTLTPLKPKSRGKREARKFLFIATFRKVHALVMLNDFNDVKAWDFNDCQTNELDRYAARSLKIPLHSRCARLRMHFQFRNSINSIVRSNYLRFQFTRRRRNQQDGSNNDQLRNDFR